MVRHVLGAVAAASILVAGCGTGAPSPSDASQPNPPAIPACVAGSTLCGGDCVRLATDNANCGACERACPSGSVCSDGACAITCAAPLGICGSGASAACTDLQNDPSNCGACGKACALGDLCLTGGCVLTGAAVCPAPRALCGAGGDAICADLDHDPANCGACGSACPSGQVCTAGTCADTCTGSAGTICGGRCVDLSSDNLHCGTCAIACGPGTSCSAGDCLPTCPAGEVRCGSACVQLDSDQANCGACGNACPDTGVCAGGSCVAVTCPARFGLPTEENIVGPRSERAFAADVDGDGLLDIVTSDVNGTTVQVLRNLGGRRFAAPVGYPTGFTLAAGLAVGDVTGDGRPDVVAFIDGAFKLLTGQPDGTLSPPSIAVSPAGLRDATLGDLDGDGRADLAIATGAQVAVSLAQPGGSLGALVTLPSSGFVQPTSVAIGDLDGDG